LKKKVIELAIIVLIFSTNLSAAFLLVKELSEILLKIYIGFHVK
jgi:hypothetical protein